jgi:hypothetical protein
MKKIILNYVECHNSGVFGLLINGSDTYKLIVATDGVLAAHDILEHYTASCIGSVTDELEALGALWWVRGVYNDIRRDVSSSLSPIEALSYNISLMADYIYNGVASTPNPLVTYSCVYDDDFQEIISLACKRFKNTMLDDINTDIFRGASQVNRYFDTAIHYMRRGYRKASRRYKKLGQLGDNSLFWNMVTAIDSQLQYISIGEQLEVYYSLSSGKVKVSIKRHSYD